MADQVVQVNADGSGKKIDVSEVTVGANTVERQRIVIGDDLDGTQRVAVHAGALSVGDHSVERLLFDLLEETKEIRKILMQLA